MTALDDLTNAVWFDTPDARRVAREGAAELAKLRKMAEFPHCPSCGTELGAAIGYYWCPNKECGQSPEPFGSDE